MVIRASSEKTYAIFGQASFVRPPSNECGSRDHEKGIEPQDETQDDDAQQAQHVMAPPRVFSLKPPASIPRLTASVMEANGLDPTHIDAFRAIQHRITMQLAKLAKRGTVRKIGQRVGVMWALPAE
jgi:hypothetical protein